MQKEEGNPGKDGFENLNKLISDLEEAVKKLEIFYNKKDYDNFEKTKDLVSNILIKTAEITKE